MVAEHLKAGDNIVIAGPEARVSIGDRSAVRVPVPSEQAPADYVDRPELTSPLLAHLLGDEPVEEGRASISVVHGLGGIGKTTVARWLVWRPEIEQRFRDGRVWVTLGNEPPDPITVITDCVSQFDPTSKTKSTVEAARADLAALLHDRSVLFVIDDVWLRKSLEVAKALMVPSLHSCFLLTTRFPQLADDPEIRVEDFPLDEMSDTQAAELIDRALSRKLSADEQLHVERLREIVGGHPLALELGAARIKEGRPWKALLSDLSAEIARLEALEETGDDLIAEPISEETRKRRKSVRASLLLSVRYLSRPGQRLFAWLGVVAEDTTITTRMAATLWSEEEETAHRHLRALSGAGLLSAKGDGFKIHDLMHDLARKLLTAPETAARAGDVPGFGLNSQDAHQRLLESYRSQTAYGLWHTLPDDGYIHNYLIRHFEQSGWGSELEDVLWEQSADGHCGWYQTREHLGQTAGFLADVGRVWSYADRLALAAQSGEIRSRAIALQLHCGLIMASINSLSAGIPTEALSGAVRCGILALPSALALARQHPEPVVRIEAMLALAAASRQSEQWQVLGEALDAARCIDVALRGYALSTFARRLPVGEALMVARGINNARWRARMLAEVAEQLPGEDQSGVLAEALSAARGVEVAWRRADALAAVAERLPPDEALAVARDIDNPWYRASTLTAIAGRLPAEEALAVARGIDDAQWRAKALAAVAGRLPAEDQPGVIGEALSAARGIDYAGSRAEALAAIAERLPGEDQPGVLGEALAAARNVEDAFSRAEALAAVAERLPPDEALAVARGIDRAGQRAKALAVVAGRLPAEDQPGVIGEALAVARGIDDAWSRAKALAAITERLPPDEALAVARGIIYDGPRDSALAAVAERLPPDEALAVARDINDAQWRAKALAVVAGRLPAEDQPGVIGEALSAARGIDYAESRAERLAAVARCLPPEDQPGILHEALRAARGIIYYRLRDSALAAIAERLTGEDQSGVVDEALTVARDIHNPGLRASTLTAIAGRLPAEEALAVARGIDDAWWRAEALAAIAERLTGEDQSGVVDEALTVARDIDNPGLRASTLTAIAGRLPAEEALAVARGIEVAWRRAEALAAIAEWLPGEDQPCVLGEALAAARSVKDAFSRAIALAAVAGRLPAEDQPGVIGEALAVARGIDDVWSRAEALAAIAERLPPDEALAVARGIEEFMWRDRALAAVAERLPAQEALAVARGIDDGSVRVEALAKVAERLAEPSIHEWIETARVLAMRRRDYCLGDLAAVLPFIQALGGDEVVRSLGRSIVKIGVWWP